MEQLTQIAPDIAETIAGEATVTGQAAPATRGELLRWLRAEVDLQRATSPASAGAYIARLLEVIDLICSLPDEDMLRATLRARLLRMPWGGQRWFATIHGFEIARLNSWQYEITGRSLGRRVDLEEAVTLLLRHSPFPGSIDPRLLPPDPGIARERPPHA